jgi:hypothetical protein
LRNRNKNFKKAKNKGVNNLKKQLDASKGQVVDLQRKLEKLGKENVILENYSKGDQFIGANPC